MKITIAHPVAEADNDYTQFEGERHQKRIDKISI